MGQQLIDFSFVCLVQCEFGIEIDVQTNPNNRYIVALVDFFNVDLRVNVFAKAGVLFPGLADFLLGFFMRTYRLAARLQLIQPISVDWIIRDIEKRLKNRLERNDADVNDCDLVQNLIDARTEVRRRAD